MYNPFSLSGKTILVTGASSGIGRATAIECAKMGATVVLTARNEERLQATLAEMTGEGHRYILADLGEEANITALVQDLPILNGAVLNAGIVGLTPVQAITATKLEQMQRINLNAPILLTRQLVKQKKLANNASLVFVASAAGVYRTSVGNAIYATTKCGLDAFMRTAALELAGKGIRCNSVNPAIEGERLNQLSASPLRQTGRGGASSRLSAFRRHTMDDRHSPETRWRANTCITCSKVSD